MAGYHTHASGNKGGYLMSTRLLLHQARLNEWAVRITDQKSSGLTVTEWCQQNNLSKCKFFYWQHLLKDEAVSQMLPKIIPLAMLSVIENSQSKQLPSSKLTRTNCTTRATPSANPTLTNRVNCTNLKHDSCVRISINGSTIELDYSCTRTHHTFPCIIFTKQ